MVARRTTVCGLSLAAMLVVLAAMVLALCAIMLAANLTDYDQPKYVDSYINLYLMLLCVMVMFVLAVLMIVSSKRAKKTVTVASIAVFTVLFVYWFVLSCVSFFWEEDCVCINYRCPETFWVAKINWTHHDLGQYLYVPPTSRVPVTTTTTTTTVATTVQAWTDSHDYPSYYWKPNSQAKRLTRDVSLQLQQFI